MPIYEYTCPRHGRFEIMHRRMPNKVPQTERCLKSYRRISPEGGYERVRCPIASRLVPSLGVYGDVLVRTHLRLTKKQRQYHQRAPEREKASHDAQPSHRKTPITSAEVQDRMDRDRAARR